MTPAYHNRPEATTLAKIADGSHPFLKKLEGFKRQAAEIMRLARELDTLVVTSPLCALAALIPNETKYLLGIKLDKLKDSAVYQRHLKDRFADQFEEFARSTGLDPRKDLWEILVSSDGKRTVMMGRGRFPVADLEPRLEREGVARRASDFHPSRENATEAPLTVG